jgi:hypothetical protein
MKKNQIISKLFLIVYCSLSLNNSNLYAKKLHESEIISTSKNDLLQYASYGNVLDKTLSQHHDKEIAIESTFKNMQISLDDIDNGFYSRMKEISKELNLIARNLRQCNKKNPDVISIQNTIQFYNSNISKFTSLCKKNPKFIQVYQILNFYKNLQSDKNEVVQWVCNKINSLRTNKSFAEWFTGETSDFFVYPLISYKDKVVNDLTWIKKNQNSDFGNLIKKINEAKQSIHNSSIALQSTNEYRIELQEQRRDQRLATLNS